MQAEIHFYIKAQQNGVSYIVNCYWMIIHYTFGSMVANFEYSFYKVICFFIVVSMGSNDLAKSI